jgi:hypothetical protein
MSRINNFKRPTKGLTNGDYYGTMRMAYIGYAVDGYEEK